MAERQTAPSDSVATSGAAKGRSRAPEFEAVFVGSGINSLVGAALLAKRGWSVAVLERSSHLGGAINTVETAGGFITELMACFHIQFLGTPGYQLLKDDLERHGLRYANTEKPFGTVTSDGRALVVTTDRSRNVDRYEVQGEGEGESWSRAMDTWLAAAEDVLGIRSVYPWSKAAARWAFGLYRRRGAAGSTALAGELLMTARDWLNENFQDPLMRVLLAPWALHGAAGPDDAGSAVVVRAVSAFSELLGAPIPVGGGRSLVAALVAIIEEAGGVCLTDIEVDRVLVKRKRAHGVQAGETTFYARRAVACSVAPDQLYERLLGDLDVPPPLLEAAAKFRPGPAGMQIAFSLDRVLSWSADEDLGQVGVVTLADSLDSISLAANQCRRGLIPAESTVVVGQPMALDPTRGPAGASQLWVQLLDMPSVPVADAAGEIDVSAGWSEEVREAVADRVQARLSKLLPGLDDSIVERIVMSPADLEASNVNLIGGSVTAGAQDQDQMILWRPSAHAPAPRTFVEGLFHIGASTHPGAGLTGSSGQLLADMLGSRRSWRRGAFVGTRRHRRFLTRSRS